jgi:hypothetical protein
VEELGFRRIGREKAGKEMMERVRKRFWETGEMIKILLILYE